MYKKINYSAIRDKREQLRIFPIDIANDLGISLNEYRSIEAGTSSPSSEVLSNICKILNISMDDMVIESGNHTVVLSIFNAKGGVGKTTVSGNLASAFAHSQNKRVLCVDLDSQCNLTTSLGVVLNEEKNIFKLFSSRNPFNERAENYIIKTQYENIDIICGSPDMDIVKESLKIATNTEFILNESFMDLINSNEYDYIIFDNEAHGSMQLYNTLYISDYAIAPLLPDDQFSIDGLNNLFDSVNKCMRNNEVFKDLKIVINRYDRRVKEVDKTLKLLNEYYPDCILNTKIRIDAQIGKAQTNRLLIHAHKKKMKRRYMKSVEDFNTLAEEISYSLI